MANTVIRILRSGISGRVPSDLDHGVLAINYSDGKLFYKDDSNNISFLKNSNSFSSINANGHFIHSGIEDQLGLVSDNIDINVEGNNIILNVKTSDSINSNSTIAASSNALNIVNNDLISHKFDEAVHTKIISATIQGNILIDSFSGIDYRTSEYMIQGKANNIVHIGKVVLTHDDAELYFTEPYELLTANTRLWNFDAVFNDNIVEVYLNTSIETNFKISRNIIPA